LAEDLCYFSVSYELITHDSELQHDLYVNSSVLRTKEKFVRIFPKGEMLTQKFTKELKSKYHQLYVPESQRNEYMKSLVKSDNFTDEQKTTVIKESAISYLENIFDAGKDFETELLSETIDGCRETVESMIDVLDSHSIESLKEMIGNLSFHDFYTYDHSINVSMYCITFFKEIKPTATRLELMHAGLGGLLHDLGKIKIPTNILNKPDKLTPEEFDEIKNHPQYGLDLLLSEDCLVSEDIDLKTISRVIHEHHENWNGSGYPNNIKEKEIHFLARICAITDFFDAITTKRSYHDAIPLSQAIDLMEKTAGRKIDPKLFVSFKGHVNYAKVQGAKQYTIADDFDSCMPHIELPLEELEELYDPDDFGKIRILDEKNRPIKKENL